MTDRCILVTGASRGIGRAIALRLARDGFDIAVHCRSRRDLAEAVVAEVEALGRNARVLEFDVADRAGCATAILTRPATGEASLIGDLCALGASWGWALTAYVARRPVMRAEGPELQLFWMVLVSAPLLLLLAPLFGPLVRDLQPLHLVGLLFQSSVVVAGGFITWLWLLSVYPSATVASFSFLTPILALGMGALIFGESITWAILLAALLVGAGIVLINRPAARASRVGAQG